MAAIKYPALFWATLIGLLITIVIMSKVVHEFWCKLEVWQRIRIPLDLKILALVYPIMKSIRFICNMIVFMAWNPTASTVGSVFAYLDRFTFFIFLLFWLSSTFRGTVHSLPQCQYITALLLCFINLLLGYFWGFGYMLLDKDATLALGMVYSSIYIIITLWILYQFNLRLCELLLAQSLEVDVPVMETQRKFVGLITRQTIIIAIVSLLDLCGLLSTIFASTLPQEYNHKQWQFVRQIIDIVKVSSIYALLYWNSFIPMNNYASAPSLTLSFSSNHPMDIHFVRQ